MTVLRRYKLGRPMTPEEARADNAARNRRYRERNRERINQKLQARRIAAGKVPPLDQRPTLATNCPHTRARAVYAGLCRRCALAAYLASDPNCPDAVRALRDRLPSSRASRQESVH